jgi:DNA polymerase III subunit chi
MESVENGEGISMKACLFHDPSPSLRDRKVFDLVEHAYNSRARVLIYASTAERAAAIDRFLWITKQESFMPHRIFERNEPDPSVTIAIVTSEINPVDADILIADGHCGFDFALGFSTIHEFVDRTSPEIQEACRERYRAYRERKISVEHLKE